MEIVYIGDRNPSNRALLILNEEWKRLGKILTKKMDEQAELEDGRRLKEMRRETSRKMVDGWDNTKLVSGLKHLQYTNYSDVRYIMYIEQDQKTFGTKTEGTFRVGSHTTAN